MEQIKFKLILIVKVKLIDIDEKTGKLKLSRKALLPRPERPKKDNPVGEVSGGH